MGLACKEWIVLFTRRTRYLLTVVTFVIAMLSAGAAHAGEARRIILMVSDGAGFNAFDAASYYEHGQLGHQPYDLFPVRLACTTFPGQPGAGYDPQQAYRDFHYVRGEKRHPYTDSAAAATALYTGVKTRNGRMSVGPGARTLVTIGELARRRGMAVGVVSSVPVTHATPGAFQAHNITRDNYAAIAREMIYGEGLDVVLGPGHPEYDRQGKPVTDPNKREYKYLGGREAWEDLRDGKTGKGWTFIERKKDFEKIAADPSAAPDRLFGVPQVNRTLQQERRGKEMGDLLKHVPGMPTMTLAALNTLGRNDRGFVVMVEGGAVDWANHDNQLGRMIEEQIDFNQAVRAAIDWIQANGGWDETLLIVTSDHECGQLWGPEADKPETLFQRPVNQGKGKLPLARHYSGSHTNALVPLYARGVGAEQFIPRVRGTDRRWGPFVDNTDIFAVMSRALPAEAAGRATGRSAEPIAEGAKRAAAADPSTRRARRLPRRAAAAN
jgi:alkaline phosphatase